MRNTLMVDNGKEFVEHKSLLQADASGALKKRETGPGKIPGRIKYEDTYDGGR
jgi:hypothetical protein